ncbi:NAD(P)/FAD-dependent oxidoreductase [bacterium endosymbiont of Bathymodiolus sp. 5 South]|jgi:sulfide:quinone oxidoreductase|uniref:NAD(P)/FAD-dependent oxidoreductase n=1 Tax=bacterium endosymbiont of Bathymodiolus sp. 5 South TaxID=1181670 RepID=UPI0010BB05D8|nr:FAD-dependent oxidoreductase [bacterium endosymbiont of Bathymodiolus sp. 5 South]CAC9650464.1 Sulfide:quinone oxidoreductase, Type VI [uncultured Gammaproteobacteria bacterium]SSC07749.1 FAD-dependent pyridine nucleotide-disulphide oxidoreductase [bacterium endosymbiont of Bathymodiolus sp. 5 South]VVH61546.1 Sulfide-quinone reductase [uncultured Gammaproteobacteria bacterium]
MKKITIIGSGFAGLTAVRTLRKQDKTLEITLISPKAELVYMPSLIWVSSGAADKKDIIIPLDNFFKRMNVRHVKNEVVGLKDNNRVVLLKNGAQVDNDALIIASGGHFIKKLPGIENAIIPCEGLSSVEKIRDKLKEMDAGNIAIGFSGNPKEPSAMRGGPMFEFLFGLDTQLRQEKRRDKFNLTFFTPAEKPGARLGEKAVESLLSEMKKRNITTHLGHKIKKFETNKVVTESGEFPADLILFMPGMTGNQWFDNTELARSEGGLLKADKFCQIEGADKVFVAGDSGSFPGPQWMPKQAHMADLQAEAAAKNALDILDDKPASHTFKIELMCIVDSNNKGIYISRTMKGSFMLPNCRLMHIVKRLFGWWYLRQYR